MNLRWRIVLPFAHLSVDCVILVLWLWHASPLYHPKAHSFPSPVAPVLFFQEDGSITFEPKFMSPPEEFLLLTSGTLPATFVSGTLRPEAHILTPTKPWDRIWFLIHEAVSFLIWFVIGVSLDTGLLRLRKPVIVYLATRFGFAVFLSAHGVAAIGWRIEVVSWLTFGVYLIVVCLRWAFSKAHLGPGERES